MHLVFRVWITCSNWSTCAPCFHNFGLPVLLYALHELQGTPASHLTFAAFFRIGFGISAFRRRCRLQLNTYLQHNEIGVCLCVCVCVCASSPKPHKDIVKTLTHGDEITAQVIIDHAKSKGSACQRSNPNCPNEEPMRQFWVVVESAGLFQEQTYKPLCCNGLCISFGCMTAACFGSVQF